MPPVPYEHQEYPKVVYNKAKESKTVADAEEEAAARDDGFDCNAEGKSVEMAKAAPVEKKPEPKKK